MGLCINLLIGLLVKSSRWHLSCGYESGVSTAHSSDYAVAHAVIIAATSLIARLCCIAKGERTVVAGVEATIRGIQDTGYRASSLQTLHVGGIRPERHEIVLQKEVHARKLCIEQVNS